MVKNYIILGQFIIILALIIFMRECRAPGGHSIQYVKQVDSFYRDTGTHTMAKISTPVPYLIEKMDTQYLPKWIHDTSSRVRDSLYYAVLEDYFSKRYYSDSAIDSNVNINVQYIVNENRSRDLSIKYRWKQPITQITYNPVAKEKNSLWLSHQLSPWQNITIGSELGYMVKNRSIYSVGAILPITGNQKLVYFKYGYKIF